VPPEPHQPPDGLREAYERRTDQLHEARSALAEAVAALTAELRDRREEAEAIRNDNRALHEQAVLHTRVIQDLRERNQQLEARLPVRRLRRLIRRLGVRRQ
jgi:predicted nuclease with TOPRIM domain